ncbi:MAG: tRNA (N(6)-L-threonylcarbamoyladenosine(37)-C(2))-methylthiotransferase [Candidatus Micrarchaeota archaeon]|nr:tRNA (N(6)-L-threonylcarbamoyladenosine(37)-C(2))-methylthiotransferase [Candidatus Micrarchaeota archaeon]
MMKAYVKTYGCTLNQADSRIISSVLEKSGVELVGSEAAADVVVVNTCTVKSATSQKILYKLNRLSGSGKRLVVTGCMAGANQNLIEKYAPDASIVTTPNIGSIGSVAANGSKAILNSYSRNDRLMLYEPSNSVIAMIGISDGCLSACSFCETKFARGRLNSFSEKLILKAIENSSNMGAKEIQLTSQDMGAYGMDRGTSIAELMGRISDMDGDFKVRVGMLNPEHLHRHFDAFADALKGSKFYKFVHIPIESGSNGVLKDMKRSYTVEEFDNYVKELRSRIPGITIETDVIAGFPTETESRFGETLSFVKRTKPDVTNMSRFGARPHALASKMVQNTRETINSRSNRLSRVVRSVQHELNDRFIGKKLDVIITERNDKSFNGRNESYKQIVIAKDENEMQMGSMHNVLINSASANVLYATGV